MIDKSSRKIICTAFANGKRHDFRLFKESKVKLHPQLNVLADTGYQGLKKLHDNSMLPKKKAKNNLLNQSDQLNNRSPAHNQ